MIEGKKNIIAALFQEYDKQTAGDIQDALKDLYAKPFSRYWSK